MCHPPGMKSETTHRGAGAPEAVWDAPDPVEPPTQAVRGERPSGRGALWREEVVGERYAVVAVVWPQPKSRT
ncbi:hypothetical protein Srubr_12670 [Streptomyces rubradiris]|uniref:Uncharacterized protein n=1 Tax=Streptomyces rubradiris TaxID=285531 RepID=A0ABQ3R6E5_STRRR|nr:hypothetical protein GCM10018792_40820 [Streptomyces rubradiris]GHI51421.1 hypothetical protein Srubr_12670 [Streptomyces rubradiris]